MRSLNPVITASLAVAFASLWALSTKPPQERSSGGYLRGQVGATKNGGSVEPAESATVYILFSSPMETGSFSHTSNLDTAGGRFREQLNSLFAKNKELKNLQKSSRQSTQPDVADQIATIYMQTVDESLAQVRSWLDKHADRAWQMKSVTPDERGVWAIDGLSAGTYELVVRGKISGYDADWEGSVDLAPGRTVSLPLTRPRFFRNKRT